MASSKQTMLCDPCSKQNETNTAIGLCKDCRELYCLACVQEHRALRATKTHQIVIITPTEKQSVSIECETCSETKNQISATHLCAECRKLYCDLCSQHHLDLAATSNHNLYVLQSTVTSSSNDVSSDFEAVSEPFDKVPNSRLYSDRLPSESISISSDFEGFDGLPSTDELGAQFPVFHSSDSTESKKDDLDKISCKVLRTFSGKSKRDEKDCDFTGIICLKNGRLLLLDYCNKKLKMFDNNLKMICTQRTNGRHGWGMTKVSEEEIAVVTGTDTVYFYFITNDEFIFQEDKVFKLDADGYGISCNGKIYAVICDVLSDNHFIKICSMTGEELHRITAFKYKPGQILNLDADGDRIFVPSLMSKTLSCVSKQGELLWEMDFDGRDVAELFNSLLVADYTDGAVVLCTKDGKYRRKLTQDNKHLHATRYISYHPETRHIFVTRCSSNNITVIQLSQ